MDAVSTGATPALMLTLYAVGSVQVIDMPEAAFVIAAVPVLYAVAEEEAWQPDCTMTETVKDADAVIAKAGLDA
ncbi:MAG: hypothetical protein WCA21_15560 [Terracidiphilus sp.]|jgi:hypothetical protein